MKIVASTQRVEHHPARGEKRDALDQRLSLWIAEAGYAFVAVPNHLDPGRDGSHSRLHEWLQAVRPSALVLSGGDDIGTGSERDDTERCLLDHAGAHGLPVLGICRGMQMMGVWAGAALKTVTGHVRSRHTLAGEVSGEVNSYHTIALVDCPPGFRIMARSEDGEIEAIRHQSLPWEGWMWHPEREAAFQPRDTQRLKALFQ